jgi:FkbM family methyltransferase
MLHGPAKAFWASVRRSLAPQNEEDWILRTFGSRRGVRFVQIGAHNGRTDDPLHAIVRRRAWTGVLVEPVPNLFAELIRNYEDVPALSFENCAICAADEMVTFWSVAPSSGTDATTQLGSLDREVVLSNASWVPMLREQLVPLEVKGMTYQSLLKKHQMGDVDLVLIDTEGHDYEVLKQVMVEHSRPKLIIYEHKHLSAQNRLDAQSLLAADYRIRASQVNTFAVRR